MVDSREACHKYNIKGSNFPEDSEGLIWPMHLSNTICVFRFKRVQNVPHVSVQISTSASWWTETALACVAMVRVVRISPGRVDAFVQQDSLPPMQKHVPNAKVCQIETETCAQYKGMCVK